jgi:hypothetical protein
LFKVTFITHKKLFAYYTKQIIFFRKSIFSIDRLTPAKFDIDRRDRVGPNRAVADPDTWASFSPTTIRDRKTRIEPTTTIRRRSTRRRRAILLPPAQGNLLPMTGL